LHACTGRVQNSEKMISAPRARLQAAKTGSPDGDTTRFYRVPTAQAPVRPKHARRSITPKRPPAATSAPEGPCEKSSPEPTRASGDKLSRCRHVRGQFSPLAASPRVLVGRWHSYVSAFHPARRQGCVLSVPCTGRVKKSGETISAPKARLRAARTGYPDGDATCFYRVPTVQAPVRPTRARRSITRQTPTCGHLGARSCPRAAIPTTTSDRLHLGRFRYLRLALQRLR
jgi:hypothetical protein